LTNSVCGAFQSSSECVRHQHTALIPFTVDHLGGIGPFAAHFLFHPSHSPLTAPPPTPLAAYKFVRQSACIAHDVALRSSLHLAHHADLHWSQSRPGVRFGRTFHTMTPQQWCFQSLSLNIAQGLGTYLQTALSTLSAKTSTHGTSPSTRTTFYGPLPYALRTPAPVLTAGDPHVVQTHHTQQP
jgi:hypothetical protein